MKTTVLIILAWLILGACAKDECKNTIAAEVKDLTGFDGCGKVLKLPNGQYAEPKNFGAFPGFEDGDKVWVRYNTANNGSSFCMVGKVVNIECMVKQ